MSAVAADIEELPTEASEAELTDLWSPKLKQFHLPGTRKVVYIRALSIAERARCEKIESPTLHDALALAVAMGCCNSKGEPLFGAFGDALAKVYKMDPTGMTELGEAILLISGMKRKQVEDAQKN